MTRLKNHLAYLLPLLAGAALLAPCAARADDQYLVDINTSSLVGTAGYLDLQFVGGPTVSTLSLTNFLTDGTLAPAAPLNSTTGGVTGTLPGPLAFTNAATNYNDYFEGLTYGSFVSFDVDLGGATLNPPAGTAIGSNFGVSLYDVTGTTPLLTSAPDGSLADIGTSSVGAPIVIPQPNATGGPSVGTITPLTPAVPEPGSLALLSLGLLPVGLLARKHRRAA